MKTRKRKMLALVICMLMFCTVVLPASAAIVQWESFGYTHAISVEVPENAVTTVLKASITDASVENHVQGQTTVITWPSGCTVNYSVACPVSNMSYFDEALDMEGLSRTVSIAAPSYEVYPISAEYASGRYTFGSEITVVDVDWSLTHLPATGIQPYAISFEDEEGTLEGAVVSYTALKILWLGSE